MSGLLFTMLTLGPAALVGERSETELRWLRDHSFALHGVQAGAGTDDLAPFAAAVGDATIVALGEGTHGTRDFFQLKHRLVEFLAREHGFSLFSMEANLPEAERVNAYVLDGDGDPRAAIAGLYFWTWNSEAVLAMVEDMRRWNESGDAYLQFTGMDMQVPDQSMEWVLGFLREADDELASEVSGVYRDLRSARGAVAVGGGLSAMEAASMADEVLARLEAQRDEFADNHGEDETERALQGARMVAQCMHARAGDPERPRDRAMADNVAWLLERHPDERIALWAHNLHVARADGWMGRYLDQRFGDRQLVVAMTTGGGTYRATRADGNGVGVFPLQEAPEGSFEHAVASLGSPIVVVDLREASADDPASRWLTEPVPFRSVGSGETVNQFTPRSLADEFDLIVWIGRSEASRPVESSGSP